MRIWSSSTSSTIVDVCSGDKSMDAVVRMVQDFCVALRQSRKKLLRYNQLLTTREDFDVVEAFKDICSHRKCYQTPEFQPENVRKCLEVIRLVNLVINRVVATKSISVSSANPQHVALLNEFWTNMKPSQPRCSDAPLVDASWLELGFQGADPTTDFRAMGELSLVQLVHFSKHRTDSARLILELFSSSNNARYFPFAIIGVNLTRFVLELIDELRVFRILVDTIAHVVAGDLSSYEVMPSEDEVCLAFGVGVVHDVYCLAFEELYLQWVIAKPAHVSQFSEIFDAVKASMRKKYLPL